MTSGDYMKNNYQNLSEPGRQFNEIMDERNDPILKERREIKELRKKHIENIKSDVGL